MKGVRFDVAEVKMSIVVFWVMTSCGLVGDYHLQPYKHLTFRLHSEDEGGTFFRNVSNDLQEYIASQIRNKVV
jgi:hypothetical protein